MPIFGGQKGGNEAYTKVMEDFNDQCYRAEAETLLFSGILHASESNNNGKLMFKYWVEYQTNDLVLLEFPLLKETVSVAVDI